MKPLYIFDLEGTTGIYTNSLHVNDTIQLRAGFRELVRDNNNGIVNIAIATRAPKYYVDGIRENMKRWGLELNCRVYTKEDVEVEEGKGGFLSFKDYRRILEEHKIRDPEADSVVLGDFLRFPMNHYYSQEDFQDFDFQDNPEVLSQDFALNDHPYPHQDSSIPVYAVLPQPWSTCNGDGRLSVDLDHVMGFLGLTYSLGQNNFARGFEKISQLGFEETVVSDELSQRVLGVSKPQRYLVFKDKKAEWKPLEKLF